MVQTSSILSMKLPKSGRRKKELAFSNPWEYRKILLREAYESTGKLVGEWSANYALTLAPLMPFIGERGRLALLTNYVYFVWVALESALSTIAFR